MAWRDSKARKCSWWLQSASPELDADLTLSPPSTQSLPTLQVPPPLPQKWSPRQNALPATRRNAAGSWLNATASLWIRSRTWTVHPATPAPGKSQKAQIAAKEGSLWERKGGTSAWVLLTPVPLPLAQGRDAQHHSTATPTPVTRWVEAGWTRSRRGRGWWTWRISAELLHLNHHPLPHTWMWHRCPQLPECLPRTIQSQGCHPVHPSWADTLPSPHPNMHRLLGTCSSSSRPTASSADRGEWTWSAIFIFLV